jgi:hypothetical protein
MQGALAEICEGPFQFHHWQLMISGMLGSLNFDTDQAPPWTCQQSHLKQEIKSDFFFKDIDNSSA